MAKSDSAGDLMSTENVPRDQLETPNADKHFDIIVNGRQRTVSSDQVSFDEVVKLAYDPVPAGPNIIIHVLYSNSAGRPREGKLFPGGSVKVQDGTVFNVSTTDKS